MKNLSLHTGKFEIIKRLKSSINGNPRYQVRVAGFTCQTAPDSCLAYGVTNYDGKKVTAIIGTYYNKPTLANIVHCFEEEI